MSTETGLTWDAPGMPSRLGSDGQAVSASSITCMCTAILHGLGMRFGNGSILITVSQVCQRPEAASSNGYGSRHRSPLRLPVATPSNTLDESSVNNTRAIAFTEVKKDPRVSLVL